MDKGRGQLQEAAALTRAVLDAAAGQAGSAAWAELILFRAELEVVFGNYAEAASLYEQAKAHARDVRPWQGAAALLRRRGSYAEALKILDEGALRLSGDDDPRGLWLERAWTLLTIGRVREARDVLVDAIKDRHDGWDATREPRRVAGRGGTVRRGAGIGGPRPPARRGRRQ